MNRSALTVAIIAAVASGSSFAATVYEGEGAELGMGGRIEGRFNVSDNNETANSSEFNDISRARLAITGRAQASDSVSTFGKYEAEMGTDSDGTLNNRYVFAGIGTSIGEFSYGKQDSAQVMLTNITDTMLTFGAAAADIVSGNQDKREANFLYSGNFDALTIQANYLAAQQADESDQSFGVAALYSINAFTFGGGFVTTDDDYQLNTVGEFSMADFTFGGLLAFGDVSDDDAYAIELSAKYVLGDVTFVGVYNRQEIDDTDTADNVDFEGAYRFNPNFRIYAGYRIEMLDNKDNQLQAGARYDF